MKYLKLEIFSDDEKEMHIILDALRTTIEREPIVDENGDSYTEILSEQELMAEVFCLGTCYQRLEAFGIECPFELTVVELEEPPVDIAVPTDETK